MHIKKFAFIVICLLNLQAFSQPMLVGHSYGLLRFEVPDNWSSNENLPQINHNNRIFTNPQRNLFFGVIKFADTSEMLQTLFYACNEIIDTSGFELVQKISDTSVVAGKFLFRTTNTEICMNLLNLKNSFYSAFYAADINLSEDDKNIVKRIFDSVKYGSEKKDKSMDKKQRGFFGKYWWIFLILLIVIRAATI